MGGAERRPRVCENVLELVGLIREVFAAIHSTPMIFVFKDFNKNGAKISYATEAIAKQKLSKIFICSGDNGNDITAWTIYKEYVELFTYDYMTILVFTAKIQKFLVILEATISMKLKKSI